MERKVGALFSDRIGEDTGNPETKVSGWKIAMSPIAAVMVEKRQRLSRGMSTEDMLFRGILEIKDTTSENFGAWHGYI